MPPSRPQRNQGLPIKGGLGAPIPTKASTTLMGPPAPWEAGPGQALKDVPVREPGGGFGVV